MRPPIVRASHGFSGELVVDSFAGGGGASTGIEAAIGRPVDIAINHSPEAIAMHRANHPETKHFCENIWEVDPREACGGRPVGLAWFSPDCTHFSRAKGTQPLKRGIRSLAWVVTRWAKAVRPRVIVLENVEEFQTWGPLDENGRPRADGMGRTFRAWLSRLTALGYEIEFRLLTAADYGTPTTRRRLFLVARRDGAPCVWPEPTHGRGRPQTWRPAADVIDWSLACPSIFERSRPLAEATLRRVAAGIQRYVLDAAAPGPFVVRHGHYSTITGAGLDEGCGAGTFRGQPLTAPLATVCATNDKHLVAPVIVKHYGDPGRVSGGGRVIGQPVERPLGTVTARDHHSLATATLGPAGERALEVRRFLAAYGAVYAQLSLVTQRFEIVDIGMRMLQPHELFAAQGFPESYEIAPDFHGKPLTKTAQIALAGNSVCPQVAEAIVAANARDAVRAA